MLSVIIPAYNVEKYIERCVNSVLNQYLKNIEIIVIDDGSKDKTSDICLKISENNKNIIYKKVQNGGCSAARNLGVSMAKGKYIAFLDSDDWVDSDMYINMIEEAEKNQADIVICGFKKLDENKNLLSTVKIPKRNNKNEYIDCTTEWFASPCNKIYKRDLLEKNNIRFLLNIYTGEDMFFNFISFFYSKNIISLDEPYYNYFMNQNSVSNNYKNRTDIYIVIRELISFYKRNGVYKENINKIRECFKYHGIMYPFDVLQKLSENKVENWKRFYIKIKEEINRLKEIETIDIKIYYYYRIFRLKMMWLKRFKKMLIEK
ncbi:glycosyltransferase, group 2 family protein [Cetobacterium somerae ATCC BAA-474]|uniref:Glycosyltransferase, group 2 family protein n=1 Tax=Cetobacterium somerae ATCC BAA-474 TaxID=1319815 RepID=U7VB84_9FUSO|nr:glycosyltransferase family 2 protein [Cetobacterium somerae]ERT68058.1 glycosyltransferase, group 2 family protein [Cetobacterium somerae ATCC BAA-474]